MERTRSHAMPCSISVRGPVVAGSVTPRRLRGPAPTDLRLSPCGGAIRLLYRWVYSCGPANNGLFRRIGKWNGPCPLGVAANTLRTGGSDEGISTKQCTRVRHGRGSLACAVISRGPVRRALPALRGGDHRGGVLPRCAQDGGRQRHTDV